jgi:hypothetical protein
VGAPSGHDGDAEAEGEGGTAASFDQLLRRAAAARAPHHDGQEPQAEAPAAEDGAAAGDGQPEDQTD